MEQKKPSSVPMILFVIVMILFVATLGMLFYKEFFTKNSKEVTEPEAEQKEEQEEEKEEINETLDINDDLVQQLYSYMAISYPWLGGITSDKTKITASEIDNGSKLFLGYLQLNQREVKYESCGNYPEAMSENNTDGILCGERNNMELYTAVISGTDLKKSVETIFGPNTYQSETFRGAGSDVFIYRYLPDKDVYVYQTYNGGGERVVESEELVSARKTNDSIILNIKITKCEPDVTTGEKSQNWTYVYQLNQDGNYYFSYMERS